MINIHVTDSDGTKKELRQPRVAINECNSWLEL